MLDDIFINPSCHIGGDGESDPLGASAPANDEIVDADDVAMNVNERPPRVARVDRSAGLKKFIGGFTERTPSLGADVPSLRRRSESVPRHPL